MAIQIQGVNGVDVKALTYANGMAVSFVPRSDQYALSSCSGLIAAAAAANGCFFAVRNSPGAIKTVYVTQFRVQYTVTTAFTAAVTAGRRLSLYRGTGAAAAGGTALPTPAPYNPLSHASRISATMGGDARIATTGTLTVTGITFETQEIESFQLAGLGAASSLVSFERRYDNGQSNPIVLLPGQLLGLRNPAAMDAAGVWQVAVDIEWYEL
jgi:hypothetical protein